MPAKKPIRISAKKRIEETPQITTHEMLWYRGKKGELRPGTRFRIREGVHPEPPQPTDRSELHTHPWQADQRRRTGLPSIQDIMGWSEQAQTTRLRAFHIASINPFGELEGYFHCRFTKNFPDAMKKEDKSLAFLRAATAVEFRPSEIQRLLDWMTQHKYLVYHHQPMKGYSFNPQTGRFQPRPNITTRQTHH